MKTEITSLRLDAQAKEKAYAIFKQVGLKPAQAINLFLNQVSLNNGLPFEVKVPNDKTLKAMQELEDGSGTRVTSTDELYKDLDI